MELISKNIGDLDHVALAMKDHLRNEVVLFEGQMGAGKTTLINHLCKAWGVLDNVSSPTYALVNEYLTDTDDTIYHFDFYRIDDEMEALDIGAEDYFYSGNTCLIEWPSKIQGIIPEVYTKVRITVQKDNSRLITLTYHG